MPRSSIQAAAEGMPNLSRRESDDAYRGVIANLNDDWRVIECRDGIQWILHSSEKTSHSRIWRGRWYLRSKNRLITICGRSVTEIDPVALALLHALPERI